jgi:hypothetical protein
MCAVEAVERGPFEALVEVIADELRAQFAVLRPHDSDDELRTFAVLLADRVWDGFVVLPRGEES